MPVSAFLIGATDPKLYSITDGVKLTTPNADIGAVLEWAEHDPFWAARGKAIQAYAQLESSLCLLFAAVGGMEWRTAVTVFYKITNTNARNAILEKLLHQKCGSKYNLFWNAYALALRQVDTRRNEIVHWLGAANILVNSDNVVLMGVTLIPPASVTAGQSHQHITTKDLVTFTGKCDEFSRTIAGLAMEIKPPEGAHIPSRDIFLEPFVYPLPVSSPFRRTEPIREIHPRSLPPLLQFLKADESGNLEQWNP